MTRNFTAEERAQHRWHDREMDTTLLDSFNDYQRSQRLSATTIRNRESLLRGFTRTTGIPLIRATTADLRKHLGRTTVAPGTARTERGALRAFYAYAVEDGHFTESPAERLPVVRVPKGEPRPFTREQIDAMLNSGAYRKTRAMILLGYYQGFRVSQIARVRGDDIDALTRTLATVSKGGKERRVPLHPVIAELADSMPQDWWFPARDGTDKPISGASVTNLVTRAKKRAGITDQNLTPHSLRHSFGSDLVEQGVDIRVVQELLLHEDLSTTQIYTRVSEKRKRAGIEAIEPMPIPTMSSRALNLAA